MVFQTGKCGNVWMTVYGGCNTWGMNTCMNICNSLGYNGPGRWCPDGRPYNYLSGDHRKWLASSSVFYKERNAGPGYGPGVSTASSIAPKYGYAQYWIKDGKHFQCNRGYTTSCISPMRACKCHVFERARPSTLANAHYG